MSKNKRLSASELTHRLKVFGHGSMANGIERLAKDSMKRGYNEGYSKGQKNIIQKMKILQIIAKKYSEK